MSDITCVLTSCDRWGLLKNTLETLIGVNCGGVRFAHTIIIEGSGRQDKPDWWDANKQRYAAYFGKIEWIANKGKRGQVFSIDRAYSMVKTSYIFHAEDDFNYVKGGDFIARSQRILEKYPEISMVSLRGDDCNGHPNMQVLGIPFKIQEPYWRGGWGGINWNPSLRRTKDWSDIGSYSRHTTYTERGLDSELKISKLFLDKGFRIAVLPDGPYIKHTGQLFSKAGLQRDPMPRILIAIPVCHSLDYGKWESGNSPHYQASNEPYGTAIHISGRNDRIEALRDTWLQDVKRFPNVEYKLFYGSPTPSSFIPKDDEVVLGVPDNYAGLPAKTIAICKYAIENNYDFVFKCDDDTFVYVDRILQEVMAQEFDYAGYCKGKMCTGGTGYWLSKKAFTVVANKANTTFSWAEDVTAGYFLLHNGIQAVNLTGHRTGRTDHWFFPKGFDPAVDMSGISALHAVQPQVMRDLYAHHHPQ